MEKMRVKYDWFLLVLLAIFLLILLGPGNWLLADTHYWQGDETAVAMVDDFTPANVEVDDVFTLTSTAIDGSTTTAISFTATAATVANVTAGLTAAWNASTSTLCTGATLADNTTKVTLTSDTAGYPFSVTSSATDGGGTDDQTLTRAAVTANDGPYNWDDTGNWTGGALPATGDTAIFDGRATASALFGLDQTGVDLAALTIRSSYTGSIGDNDADGSRSGPLIIECSGTVNVEGTGNYYIQCGNDAADADIAALIINTAGTVGLSSQKNEAAGSVGEFTVVRVINTAAVVYIYGAADSANTNAQSGTFVKTLWVVPERPTRTAASVTIGNLCYDQNEPENMNIYHAAGNLTLYTQVDEIRQYGGIITMGGTGYDMGANDDGISSLVVHDGTFSWHPSDVSGSAMVKAAPGPVITSATIFGAATFDASGMLETDSSAPTITNMYQYPGATVELDNGYANFTLTNYYKYGGTLTTAPGQAVTLQ